MGTGGGIGSGGASRSASPVPQQRLIAERRWQLGIKAKGHPAAIMSEVLRTLQALEIPWKRIAPYNLKCRCELLPPTPAAAAGEEGGRAGGTAGSPRDIMGEVRSPCCGAGILGTRGASNALLLAPLQDTGEEPMMVDGMQQQGKPHTYVRRPVSRGGPDGNGGGNGAAGPDPGVLKFELMLYKVRSDEYMLDIQSIAGDCFSFMDVCAGIMQELRFN